MKKWTVILMAIFDIIIILTGCSLYHNSKETNTIEPTESTSIALDKAEKHDFDVYEYYNEEYDFILDMPLEEYNIELASIDNSDDLHALYNIEEDVELHQESIALQFSFSELRSDDLDVSGVLFAIIVIEGGDEVYEGDFLGNKDNLDFYFYAVNGPTESTGFNKMIEVCRPMVKEIKTSFKIREK